MKITLTKNNKEKQTLRVLSLDKVMNDMKEETHSRPVSSFRAKIASLPWNTKEQADHLPVILFGVLFRRKKDQQIYMSEYNGIILLEINRLSGPEEVMLVRKQAMEVPQTLAAFKGCGGKSVKILVRFTRPDNSLPVNREEALIYHSHAYIKAVKIYAPQISYPIDFKEPLLERGCKYSYDPYLYYNPQAHPIIMEQPEKLPDDIEIPEISLGEPNPVKRMLPGYEKFHAISLLFETSLNKTWETTGEPDPESNLKEFLYELGRNCFRSGVLEEDTIHWTLVWLDLQSLETEVRQTIRNIYRKMDGFGNKPCISPAQLTVLKINEFLNRRYEFRYNVQTQEVEYKRNLSACFHFQPVDERILNRIVLEAQEEGIQLWDRDIRRHIHSDRIPTFHPLENYLSKLPAWDGKGRIRELAAMLPCPNSHWPDFFYRWFLGMVAQWMGKMKEYGNSSSPLLVSKQGLGKSTFCRQILPPELRSLYNDRIDFSKKRDAELYLNRFALINIDEFDQISEKDQAFLKHILQKPEVMTRKPYKSSVESMDRYASFIATSNHKNLLTDLSGNRRFICIEITDRIDNNLYIDYAQLYAQAVTEIRNGERFYFTPEEQALLAKSNEEFRLVPPMEQLFKNYFEKVEEEKKEEGMWMLAIQIQEIIKKRSGINLSDKKVTHFGHILSQLGLQTKKSKDGVQYLVKEKIEILI